MRIDDIDSPALLLRRSILRANLERMAAIVVSRGLSLRPHIKSHKTPGIARLQIASGACGVTVAKVGEAEVTAEAGVADICVATEIVIPGKLRRLTGLARDARVSLVIDSEVGARTAAEVARAEDVAAPALLEVDTGQRRCGVTGIPAGRRLARSVRTGKNLELIGVLAHEGHVYPCRTREELERASVRAADDPVAIAHALRGDGHDIRIVSAGSAVSVGAVTAVAGSTELRPGTYASNEVRQVSLEACAFKDRAVSVLATVISASRENVVVPGARSQSIHAKAIRWPFSFEYSGHGWIKQCPTARIVSLSEEHAGVELGRSPKSPAIAGRGEVVPNHVCQTVNLHDELHVADGAPVVDAWRIAARGRTR